MATDQGFLAVVLGALDVGLAFWLLGRLPVRPGLRAGLTVFVGAGTVLWYASSLGTTWFLAHVVAVGLTLAAVGVALGADEQARLDPGPWRPVLDRSQVLAGFLLGLAVTSRLTVVFGAAFLLFVGGGGSWPRRALSAALGMALPIGALLVYNLAVSGTLFNPVYESLYRYEVWAYPELNYNSAWALQDLRYIPQNLGIMLGGLPDVMPACAAGVPRELWSAAGCSWLVPTGRDEPPPHQPGVARRGRRAADPAGPTGCGWPSRNAGYRDRQPDALLAGMGAVRLPVQPRLRAVPARASGAGCRAPPRGAWLALGARRHPGRRPDRGLRRGPGVGPGMGSDAGLVSGASPQGVPARLAVVADSAAPWLVGILGFAVARSTLLPGLGLWDTGEFPDRRSGARHGTSHGLPELRPPGLDSEPAAGAAR